MATPKPKPKTPSQAAQRRAEPSSSQSTLTTARKRLNAGTPSKQSGPPSKKRKISKLEQLPEEEDASGDAAFQNAVAQEAERQDLQPADLLRRSHRARAAASTAPGRNTPPSQRSSPPSAQPRPASGRPQAVEDQDDEYEPGEDGEDEDAEEEENDQTSTPLPRSAKRPARTPKSTATIPTGTPAPISSAAPKDMTAEELKRVAGSFTTGEIMSMQRVVTQFGEQMGFEPFKVNEIIHSDPKSNNYAKSIFNKLHDVCPAPGHSRRQVMDKARKLFHNFEARGKWSAEEDAQLLEHHQRHPNKWKYIGELMNRHDMDIRDHFQTLTGSRKRAARKDKWRKEEKDRLLDFVFRAQEVIQGLREEVPGRTTRPLAEDIPWEIVADFVGGERTAKQCRTKWEKELGRGDESAPAPSSSKGKAVASSSRGVRSNTRSKLASRQPSIELGRSQSRYKSSERVEESDSEEEEDQEMGDGDQEGQVEEDNDKDQEMGDEDREGEVDDDDEEIPDSQPAHGEQDTARAEDLDDEADGLPAVEQPLLLPPPAVEPDEEEHEHLTPGDLLVKPSEPEDEDSPPQVNGSRSRSPGIKTEQPDDLPVVNGTAGEKSSSEEDSEEDSSEPGSDDGSSDDGEDDIKNEPSTSSSEGSSDSSSPESEEESSSDDGSSSDEDASSGEESSSSDEVQEAKKRPARKTAPKSASQPTTSYTQDRFTKAPTSPLETRKSPLAKSSTQPATEGHRVNGVAQGRTPGKSSTQPVTNGNAASRSSSKNSTNSKKGSQRSSRSSSKASRSKSEPSSDSDVEDIPNTAPPLMPNSARRLTAAVTRRLNW